MRTRNKEAIACCTYKSLGDTKHCGFRDLLRRWRKVFCCSVFLVREWLFIAHPMLCLLLHHLVQPASRIAQDSFALAICFSDSLFCEKPWCCLDSCTRWPRRAILKLASRTALPWRCAVQSRHELAWLSVCVADLLSSPQIIVCEISLLSSFLLFGSKKMQEA